MRGYTEGVPRERPEMPGLILAGFAAGTALAFWIYYTALRFGGAGAI